MEAWKSFNPDEADAYGAVVQTVILKGVGSSVTWCLRDYTPGISVTIQSVIGLRPASNAGVLWCVGWLLGFWAVLCACVVGGTIDGSVGGQFDRAHFTPIVASAPLGKKHE